MASHKTPVDFPPSVRAPQTSWCASFHRSKFCLAYWLLSSVVSLVTPQYLKDIFITAWGLILDFHITQGTVDTPSSGKTHPIALLQQPQAGGIHYLCDWQWTWDKKSPGNAGKRGQPKQATCLLDSVHGTKVGKLITALVVRTSWTEAVWYLFQTQNNCQFQIPNSSSLQERWWKEAEALWVEYKKSPKWGVEYFPRDNSARILGWEIKSQL
jgi:hypothetical protein